MYIYMHICLYVIYVCSIVYIIYINYICLYIIVKVSLKFRYTYICIICVVHVLFLFLWMLFFLNTDKKKSKALDTVNRKKLFEILEMIFVLDELHVLKILPKELQIKVRINKESSKYFKTTIGIPQGDALKVTSVTKLFLAIK